MNVLSSDQVIVSLGSNTERDYHIHQALDALLDAFGELCVSSVYQSQALVGNTDAVENEVPGSVASRDYWNLVVGFVVPNINLDNQQDICRLQQILKNIEQQCGRKTGSDEVTMDIDLLCMGGRVGVCGAALLPRPEISNCAYILRPLAELFPDIQYPGKAVSFLQCWDNFKGEAYLQPVDFVWRDAVISVAPPCLPI